jgi:Ca2+-binding EF-hand superfamily protein
MAANTGALGVDPGQTSSSAARQLRLYGDDGVEIISEPPLTVLEDASLSDANNNGVISKHEALDLNGDGVVSKSEKSLLDADGDGTVTPLELMLPLISGAMSSDTDGDGHLSKHEALDLNGDGKVSKEEKTILDADGNGAVSPQELWTTLEAASEDVLPAEAPPVAGSSSDAGPSSDEAMLAEILGRYGVGDSASQALIAELLRWKAVAPSQSRNADDGVVTAYGGGVTTLRVSLPMPGRDLPLLNLWASPLDAMNEIVLFMVTLATLVNIGKWAARRFCGQRYAKVVQTGRLSQAPLVCEGEASQQPPTPSTERLAETA